MQTLTLHKIYMFNSGKYGKENDVPDVLPHGNTDAQF